MALRGGPQAMQLLQIAQTQQPANVPATGVNPETGAIQVTNPEASKENMPGMPNLPKMPINPATGQPAEMPTQGM